MSYDLLYVNLDITPAAHAQVMPKLQFAPTTNLLTAAVIHYIFISASYHVSQSHQVIPEAKAKSNRDGVVVTNMRQKLPAKKPRTSYRP